MEAKWLQVAPESHLLVQHPTDSEIFLPDPNFPSQAPSAFSHKIYWIDLLIYPKIYGILLD